MPFGPDCEYPTFDDCVKANQGKKDPEGYCARIQQETEEHCEAGGAMGTRFRTMLAPINKPTGDGRRFAEGALTLAPTPFPLEWVRERGMGHDGAVVIGAVQTAEIRDGGVWGEGVLFDDVDREEMPRLAEDVAEAMKLVAEGVLGPSVDLDSFDAIPVVEGTDDPPEEHEWDDPDIRVELLVTEGRVRAGTLVDIPAFVETVRPFELLEAEGEPDDDQAGEAAARLPALVASVAAPARPALAAFDRPEPDELTPITYDWETGEVYGHVAAWNTCHTGFADVCVVAPRSASGDYPGFHRFPVETADGVVWAGRLTAGGRHPDLSLTAAQTTAFYDQKPAAAYVRARDGKLGLWVSGVTAPDLDERTRRVLNRRKVSGDWRETAEGLSLLEILALAPGPRLVSEPGFPVAVGTRDGRQVALTAALGPSPEGAPTAADYADMRRAIRDEIRTEHERQRAATELRSAIRETAAPVRSELAGMLEGVG